MFPSGFGFDELGTRGDLPQRSKTSCALASRRFQALVPSIRRHNIDSMLGGPIQRRTLGGLLVTGWATYMTVVVASNFDDLLESFGWIHTAFHSGNLAFLETATRIYFHSRPVDQVLLVGVLVWEASSAALLWYGAIGWQRKVWRTVGAAEAGLIVIALLWMAFAIATELFVAYDRGVNESAYWVLAIANLVTLVVVTQFRRDLA
jgi:hypothetical protein